ncbi:MAG: glycoside hydrolase family 99-like domain-containing protein [Phycisphaerae bacterium]|nr:glycoside hydrolase family 99-like domain-containing protein [Phycisphaerae bacterium]
MIATHALMSLCVGTACCAAAQANPTASTPAQAAVRIHRFLPDDPLSRAQRPTTVSATIENAGDKPIEVRPALTLPDGLRIVGAQAGGSVRLDVAEEAAVSWRIQADKAGPYDLVLRVDRKNAPQTTASLSMRFLPPVEARKLPYIPEPKPVKTPILIGAHHCPLWEADKPEMWAQLLKHPERTPALGFYAQENPEVSDWETKWAVEHGVSFFIYCWYRASQGEPVKTRFSSAIHDALFKSKFADKMKFTIMWENQARGQAGVADEKDLMVNLLPFWMDNYFKHPSYLKIDNKPLLFIYRPEFLVQDLGGVEQVAKAFDRMRQTCKDSGFAGLYLLGEYRGLDANHLKLMKQLGLDYTFAYCWHVSNNPTPEQAIRTQMDNIKKTQALGIMPQVVTVSQGWSGWADEGSIWTIPPDDYKTLLRQAKDFVAAMPPDQLGSKLLLLDNWNEWGEGHYIAPYRQYGFGYLDAVRDVFSDAPGPHVDLIPDDVGMGPYDTAYKAQARRLEELRKLGSKRVLKRGAPEPGLIGWWAFDEEPDGPVALDYSGNRLGGKLFGATRAQGIDGRALVCKGGCVLIAGGHKLSPRDALTIECWVKTDAPGQDNKWFVNRVFSGGTSAGYRLGLLQGKPCFEVPVTSWSHHLSADAPLPTGRWVHLAGTFDGKTMRIYVDGQERGVMDRPGPVHANEFPLCLGSYARNHAAYFKGLLDEVRLYDRALTADEVRSRHRALAGGAEPTP